jgi:hypothetical protein
MAENALDQEQLESAERASETNVGGPSFGNDHVISPPFLH